MPKRAIAFALVIMLLGGVVGAFATAGTADDPLVSQSFAEKWAKELLNMAQQKIDAQLGQEFDAARTSISSGGGASAARVSVPKNGLLRLDDGASATLISGAATVRIDAGAFVNATVGAEAKNGKVNLNQLYIACGGADVSITASADSVLLVDGRYSVDKPAKVFTDVPASSWYASYVAMAVKEGLIDGTTETTYEPQKNFTLCEAIKIAACLHQRHNEGKVTLQNGSPWYRSYVDYAVENGVAEERYASLTDAEYTAPISRREYIHLFYNALPASEYAVITSIADGAVPDVAMGDSFAAEIYAFYRAGILNGATDDGACLPDRTITRAEVAAIIARMIDASIRKPITLP